MVVGHVKGDHALPELAPGLRVCPGPALCQCLAPRERPGEGAREELRLQPVPPQQVGVHVDQEQDAHAVQVDVESLVGRGGAVDLCVG